MYKTEFPDFKLDVCIPAGFIDNSWHNDTMPNFIREFPDGRWVVLWIDFADPAKREILPQSGRFSVYLMDDTMTDVHESFITAEYDEVLQKLTDYFPLILLSDTDLRESHSELWSRVPDSDHARAFQDWDSVESIDAEISARATTSNVF